MVKQYTSDIKNDTKERRKGEKKKIWKKKKVSTENLFKSFNDKRTVNTKFAKIIKYTIPLLQAGQLIFTENL